MADLAQAFAALDGIESASVRKTAINPHRPANEDNFWLVEMFPEVGDRIWLFADKRLTENDPPEDVAAFYSECVAQHVRKRRGECPNGPRLR